MDRGTTSDDVINQLKSILAKYGILERLGSDCCPRNNSDYLLVVD